MQRPYPNDPRLTGIAIAFRNGALIADRVMPRVPVGKSTFKWNEYDFAEGITVPVTIVGRRAARPRSSSPRWNAPAAPRTTAWTT